MLSSSGIKSRPGKLWLRFFRGCSHNVFISLSYRPVTGRHRFWRNGRVVTWTLEGIRLRSCLMYAHCLMQWKGAREWKIIMKSDGRNLKYYRNIHHESGNLWQLHTTSIILYVDTVYGYMYAVQYSICLPTLQDTSVKLNPKYSVTLHHAVK
jgi:hypothetical protein